MNRLLSALAPRGAGLAAAQRRAPVASDDAMGILPLLMVAGKGINLGVKAGQRWAQSPAGQQFLSKLKETVEKKEGRAKEFRTKAASAKTPEAKARWERRAQRQQEMVDAIRQEQMLAGKGIVGEGPVLEYRRNLLSMEWDDASDARKAEIQSTIAQMDDRLKKLSSEQKLLAETTGEKVGRVRLPPGVGGLATQPRGLVLPPRGGGALVPGARPALTSSQPAEPAGPAVARGSQAKKKQISPLPASLATDALLTQGVGGLRFTAQAPPGSGRLVRIPFYPVDNAQSWTGITGIEFPGDDPVVRVALPPGARRSRPILLQTEQFDYGKYRILGFQTNEQSVVRPVVYPLGAVPGFVPPPAPYQIGPAVVTFARLQLYNGQTLFLQEDQVWSAPFNVYPASYAETALSFMALPPPAAPVGAPAPPYGGGTVAGFPSYTKSGVELPSHYVRRRNRWFQGLRDYPVVTGTTEVTVVVQVYTVLPNPEPVGGVDFEFPVTCNLIVDMVEDKVFGDPVNPSPAARPGAMVKASARELGVTADGRQEIELVAARTRLSAPSLDPDE